MGLGMRKAFIPEIYAGAKSAKKKKKKKKKGKKEMKTVKAPKGFHWMKKGKNNYKLMKHTGKFVPHKGASLAAKFEVQKKHKG